MSAVGKSTVGGERLSAEVTNTDATWLAGQLTDRGVAVQEVQPFPDECVASIRPDQSFGNHIESIIEPGTEDGAYEYGDRAKKAACLPTVITGSTTRRTPGNDESTATVRHPCGEFGRDARVDG